MATRAEVITIIEANVVKVLRNDVSDTRYNKIDRKDGSKTEIENIPCLVEREDGSVSYQNQTIYVDYDKDGKEVEAWMDKNQKNFEESGEVVSTEVAPK